MSNDKPQARRGARRTPPATYSLLKAWRFFKRLVGSTGRVILNAPVNWGIKGWAASLLLIIAVTLAGIFKRPIHGFFVGDDKGIPEFFADIARMFGDGEVVVATVFLSLLIGLAGRRLIFTETGLVLATAGVWCAIFTLLGQTVLAEARPGEGGAMAFFALNGHGVSGHASSAAVLFWPIYSVLGEPLKKAWRAVLGVLLSSWALLVAWSRMWDDKHFLWNVILGLTVGFAMGYAAVKAWEENKNA